MSYQDSFVTPLPLKFWHLSSKLYHYRESGALILSFPLLFLLFSCLSAQIPLRLSSWNQVSIWHPLEETPLAPQTAHMACSPTQIRPLQGRSPPFRPLKMKLPKIPHFQRTPVFNCPHVPPFCLPCPNQGKLCPPIPLAKLSLRHLFLPACLCREKRSLFAL